MEREKMIEEMLKALEPITCCGYVDEMGVNELAEKLVNLRIYAVPEGAVVLTREEYERLKKEELYAKGKYNLCHGDRGIEGTAKTTEQLGQTLIEYDRRVREAYDKIIPQLLEENKQVRKETAKRIYEKAKKKKYVDNDDESCYWSAITLDDLADICGVEVEE